MHTRTAQHSVTDIIADQHLPPLDAFDQRTASWDRQIEAVRAWQEAHGNTDGEACQWRGTVSAARPMVDRRKRTITIDFADRRRAA